MPFVAAPPSCRGARAASVAIHLAVAGLSLAAASVSMAQAPAPVESRIVQLEQVFWICDYSATTRVLSFDVAAACSTAYEALVALKFKGDPTALHAWWREHKAARYRAFEQMDSPGDTQGAPLQRY